jgi:polyhydroxybutyrate depolymerase
MSKFFLKNSYVFYILFIFLMSSCEKNGNNSSVDENGSVIVGLFNSVLSHDGLARQFIVYVPTNYNTDTDYPLMINFHGFGGTASDFVETADMRSLAESENFIVVYPQGTLLGGYPHWNSSAPSSDNKSSVDDIGFVEALIENISSTYSINENRIYAAGYSNGGFMSYYLACNSTKFAAIGSVAGTMIDDSYQNCNALIPTAMINIHGTADSVVLYEGDSYGSTAIKDVVTWWKNFNSCLNEDVLTNQNGSIEQQIFYDDSGNPYVQHIKIYDGGHYWSDKLSFNGKNTSELIWDFVSQFNLDGTIN